MFVSAQLCNVVVHCSNIDLKFTCPTCELSSKLRQRVVKFRHLFCVQPEAIQLLCQTERKFLCYGRLFINSLQEIMNLALFDVNLPSLTQKWYHFRLYIKKWKSELVNLLEQIWIQFTSCSCKLPSTIGTLCLSFAMFCGKERLVWL